MSASFKHYCCCFLLCAAMVLWLGIMLLAIVSIASFLAWDFRFFMKPADELWSIVLGWLRAAVGFGALFTLAGIFADANPATIEEVRRNYGE